MSLWLYRFLSGLYSAFSLYLFFPSVFFVLFSSESEETEKTGIIINCVFILCAVFYAVFSFLLKLYYKAKLYYSMDKKCLPPSVFFSISMTFRFIKLRFLVFLKKLFLTVIFFFPCFLVFFITVSGLLINGSMIRSVFYCLLSLGLTLFILGAVFSFSYCGKYFICDYLFYLNPRMPVSGIIKTASSLLSGKLISTAFFRASLLPWRMLCVFLIPLPFASVYSDACKAYKADEIYSDREYYRNFTRLFKGISLVFQKKMREADTGILPPL